MFDTLLSRIFLIFAFLILVYECIVNINIIRACKIYINKRKYQKLQKEVDNNESGTNS